MLIMLREAGRTYDHVLRKHGYKYVDMLIVAGGGRGGDDAGGGGSSGGMLYIKDFITSRLNVGETVRFEIPYTSWAKMHIKNRTITVYGGQDGYSGSDVGHPGEGGSAPNFDMYGAYDILSRYLKSPEIGVSIIYACNGGGAGAGKVLNAYPHKGGSGASTSSDGLNTGKPVENKDGLGGYTGGTDSSGSKNPGKGITFAKVPIPIKSVFGSTAFSGKALQQTSLKSSGGGGAAGFGSGGYSGNGMGAPNGGGWGGGGGGGGTGQAGREGGNGITLLYYHN